ncbi:hypothetical protein [Jejuia pallidilutea]|nr:hypothetical protein [Jejuia pallidilutea]GAL66477.1 hypothetical protein JCM19301_2572 [Jejuia pallidilutea]
MKANTEDQNIESESAKSNYLGIVIDNLRANKKIARNSFWMLLSVLLYVVIIFDKESISDIGILFAKINNNLLLINFIPVFFSFIFLQNMALWNNNINLTLIFKKLTKDLFKLGVISDTYDVIEPFSLTHHVINYQFNNKKISSLFKLPSLIMLVVVMITPVLFIVFSIVQIIRINDNILSFIPLSSAIITGILGISAILQALSTFKEKK